MNFEVIEQYLPLLFKGCVVTLQISLLAQCFAIVLGFAVALLRVASFAPLRAMGAAYVHVTRGIPVLVHIYFAYFALPSIGIKLSPITAGVLALGIYSSGYVAEAVRAGIQALPRGQFDSGSALGFSYLQTMRRIVFPQVIKFTLPSLTSECVSLLKASSLTSVISVSELTWAGQIAAGESFAAVEIYLAVAALYLCMNLVLIYAAQWLERRQQLPV